MPPNPRNDVLVQSDKPSCMSTSQSKNNNNKKNTAVQLEHNKRTFIIQLGICHKDTKGVKTWEMQKEEKGGTEIKRKYRKKLQTITEQTSRKKGWKRTTVKTDLEEASWIICRNTDGKKHGIREEVKNVKWWRKKTKRGCTTFINLIIVRIERHLYD